MAETSKSSHSSPSGTTPAGNGVSGGGEPGFHSQQMQQQFAYSSKFQSPLGLHQQRPVMVPYEQHSVSHQQGPYAHHAPYHQLLQQQQVQYHQQPHQQTHQQTHQQQHHHHQSIQFMQQAENVQQQSMQYVQDEQKSSDSQFKQKLESSDSEAQVKEDSSRVTTATEKPAIRTGSASAKDSNLTPEQRDIVAKELEAVRAAHEKQVKELEERIKSLEEQKSQKEVKYLRVTNVQKKKKLKKSLESENIKGKSALDDNQEKEMDNCEDIDEVYTTRSRSGIQKKKIGNSTLDSIQKEEMDTCEDPEECDVFDSCPSPANSVYSDVSIKEEQDDDIPAAKTYYEKKKAIKATIEKEESKSDPENKPPKSYTLSVTDFDFCIYCQNKSEKKMLYVTDNILATIQSIVLNIDCESSQRLKDYVLDIDMFFNNLPQYHPSCQNKLRNRLQIFRKKKKNIDESDISLCVICQENKIELLNNCTNKWFASLWCELNKLDGERIEQFQRFLNFDRLRKLVEGESMKDQQFSSEKFKFHKSCRYKFIVKDRPKKILKTLSPELEIPEPENMERNVEITADEEIFELLAKRKKVIEKRKQKKQRKELPEPDKFDYKRCVICGTRSKGHCKTMTKNAIQKTRDTADNNQHSDIVKILEHGVNFDLELLYHDRCFRNYKRPIRVKKGTVEYMEKAFGAIITEIEDPMFKDGKVFRLVELREKYLKNLMEFKIESDSKMKKFVEKIRKYYTFKKCRVNIISYPDYLIYSNHLSESQVAPQINILKKCKKEESHENSSVLEQVSGDLGDSNRDSVDSKIKSKYRFLCTECGYKCQKKSSLKNHIKKHELKSVEEIILSKQFMCDVCGKMLKNQKSLQNHIYTHSDKKEKYSCSQCNRTFLSKDALKNHALTHTGEKNVECPYCDKKFLIKKYIYRHIRLVHETKSEGQIFPCSECGQKYKTKQRLNEHSRKHSDARPFVCKECGKSFKYRSPWKTHMLAHEGKKPYMCSICSFGCYTKANLKIHMALHSESNEQVDMYSDTENVNERNVLVKNISSIDELPNNKTQTYFEK